MIGVWTRAHPYVQGEERSSAVVEALAGKSGSPVDDSRLAGAIQQLEEALASAAADAPPDLASLLPTQVPTTIYNSLKCS